MKSHSTDFENRIKKEIAKLIKEPTDGIVCYPKDDSLSVLTAYIGGPPDTPYQGGNFSIEITIPDKYPFCPPSVRFTTKIYHPNIDSEGRVCIENLKPDNWSPTCTIEKILISLRGLLMAPNVNDPLVVDIARQYVADITKYNKTAKDWTRLHAMTNVVGPSSVL